MFKVTLNGKESSIEELERFIGSYAMNQILETH